jgi:Nuclear pore localisation protein NPL4
MRKLNYSDAIVKFLLSNDFGSSHFFQIIRVQTPDGMKRVSIPISSTLRDLYEKVYKSLNLVDYGFSLFSDRNCSKEIHSSRSQNLKTGNLKHGDVVYYKQMAGSSVSYKYLRLDNVCFSNVIS